MQSEARGRNVSPDRSIQEEKSSSVFRPYMNSFLMPSGMHKRKKNWDGKLESRENKGTRKVNGFFTTVSLCGGVSKSKDTCHNLEKSVKVLSSPTEQQRKSPLQSVCMNIHFSGLKFSHQNATLIPHAKLLNTGGFKINAFVSSTHSCILSFTFNFLN